MPKKSRKPAYQLHRGSGQAKVRIDGKDVYLGGHGSPASRDRYEQLVGEYLRGKDVDAITITVDELCLMFLDWADGYYRRADGSSTGAVANIRDALRYVVKANGSDRARDFGPKSLKAVRDLMIADRRCRSNINRLVHWLRRAFAWGVSEELLPVTVHQALLTVKGLQRGRTKAVESEAVRPVAEGDVTAALPFLPATVAAMVRLQLLTGARPGEICALRPCDVTRGLDGVWCYRPSMHKTQHHGKERRIYIGAEGQKVLQPFLDREPEAFCFDPHEAGRCRPKLHRYSKDSYGRAVHRACVRAGLDRSWSPGQLRHTKATMIRERFGIEAAQMVLGHSKTDMTEVYAERNFTVAADVMKAIG